MTVIPPVMITYKMAATIVNQIVLLINALCIKLKVKQNTLSSDFISSVFHMCAYIERIQAFQVYNASLH